METPLVNGLYELKKMAGKGGWTYTELPEIKPDPHAYFGWVKVCGSIDGFELKRYRLMPMGNGNLFLPVRAEIRKQIKKKAGDWVQVILYIDHSVLEIPEEISSTLRQIEYVYETFITLSESEQEHWIKKINSVKKAETKVQKLMELVDYIQTILRIAAR